MAMIQPIKTVRGAEIEKTVCQSSPMVKVTQATPKRKTITSDVKKAYTKIAATISAVVERITPACLRQEPSRATITAISPTREQ
jgi:hypothetical protein